MNSKNAITQYSRDTWRQEKKRGGKTENAQKESGGERTKRGENAQKGRGTYIVYI